MAYNYDTGYKYFYPVTFQTPNSYMTQCDPQSYYSHYFNAYQNQLRNLQKRQVTMEYWTRQLEYFRNLLKNFAAAIESPEELKKLMTTCNCDVNSKKCFEKLRKFFNLDKNFGKCCCNSCFDKTLSQLCNALSVSASSNQCMCSTCRRRGRKPCCPKQTCTNSCQNVPGYCHVPYQAPAYPYYYPYQAPAYPYYYYPYQTTAPPNYCQTMPQQCNNTNKNSNCCPPNCDKCCNKCKLKNIINQINYILSSAEKMKNVPSRCGGAYECNCACSCACNLPRQESCCSIKEIKEETVTIMRENIVENDDCQKNPANPNNSSSSENCQEHYQENRKGNSIRKPTKYSEDDTTDDSSNLSEENRNCGTRVNKQALILLGEEYISPSGTFEVLIENECECCNEKKKRNKRTGSNMKFQVDYTTYTKPKCFQI